MKERTALTIKGKVQKVGFRTFVEKQAIAKGLTGYASNLADKSVLVVCEGEQTKISDLIDAIEKSSFDIKDIQKTHGKATGEFKSFERIGEDVPREDATLGDVIKVLKSFDVKAEQLVKMQRKTQKTIERGNKELGGKIDSFHQDMSSHFELLDDKYGIIAEMIGKAVEGIEKTNKNMERNTGKILKETGENTEKILTRMEKQQEAHNQIIEKLIKTMINKSNP